MDNTDELLLMVLKLPVKWVGFKRFCKEKTSCKGCPFFDGKICTMTTDEIVLQKLAKAASIILVERGLI